MLGILLLPQNFRRSLNICKTMLTVHFDKLQMKSIYVNFYPILLGLSVFQPVSQIFYRVNLCQVLNRYHWMYSALALNHPYQDTGLFTINGSSHPSHVSFVQFYIVLYFFIQFIHCIVLIG